MWSAFMLVDVARLAVRIACLAAIATCAFHSKAETLERKSPHLSIQLAHARSIEAAATSIDNQHIAVLHFDNTAWIWTIKQGRPTGPIRLAARPVAMALVGVGSDLTLATVDREGVLSFHEIGSAGGGHITSKTCSSPSHLWARARSLEVICVDKDGSVESIPFVGRQRGPSRNAPIGRGSWQFASSPSALVAFAKESDHIVVLGPDSEMPRQIGLPPGTQASVAAVAARSGAVVVGTEDRSLCVLVERDGWNCTDPFIFGIEDVSQLIATFQSVAIAQDGCEVTAISVQFIVSIKNACSTEKLQAQIRPSKYQMDLEALQYIGADFLLMHTPRAVFALDRANHEELLTFAVLRDDAWGGTWAVVTPSGRFDSGDIESARDLFAIANEDQETTAEIIEVIYGRGGPQAVPRRLSPMISVRNFMRDYFEPRLLTKVMQDGVQFKPLADYSLLNRVSPRVRIKPVHLVPSSRGSDPRAAFVTVETQAVQGFVSVSGVVAKYSTRPYDLRLFRNGQLVGQWPEPKASASGPQDRQAWRKASLVPMEPGQTMAEHTFRVALPSKDRGKPVVFTAYAFNEDRVKSETARNDEFKVPEDMPLRKPRAYVITVGVNSYELKSRDLSFAAKDARDLGEALARIKDHEVVRLTLVSEDARPGAAATRQATKANIRGVLELLAGKSEGERTRLKGVPGIDAKAVEQLRKATPDDVVVIAFSGHGYTDPASGQFYLLPSDSGKEAGFGPGALSRFVSSEELSQWLREVDAGQMAMIIDACHSASAVDQPGFKPGPMGDRGLGQLAYDKGMMILAATQTSDAALEVQKIKQGLLTYALVAEGFKQDEGKPARRNADIDRDGAISLREWLQYGERRVPGLYEDIRAGKVSAVHKDPKPDSNWRDTTARKAQTPSLFNFQRSTADAVLER